MVTPVTPFVRPRPVQHNKTHRSHFSCCDCPKCRFIQDCYATRCGTMHDMYAANRRTRFRTMQVMTYSHSPTVTIQRRL